MVNEVHLIGNLGDEVKMHYFENGNCMGRFPLATSRHWTDKEGQKQSKTSWHNVVVSNKTAEMCEKYLKKGSKAYVSGSIEYTQWQDEAGQTRYGVEIRATRVKFLDSKGDGEGGRQEQMPLEKHAGDEFLEDKGTSAAKPQQMSEATEEEDDLPF